MSLGLPRSLLGCARPSQLVRPSLLQTTAPIVRPFSTIRAAKPPRQSFKLPFFTPAARSNFFYPSHAFKVPRSYTTAAPVVAEIPKSLPYWLYGCSALVFGIVVIGGLTRLTESGLSIVEWQPITGILPPITKEEWDAEWEKYKVSPEGMIFVLPTAYYLARYKLPGPIRTKLMLIGLGIGFQGFLGWWMVKSGLKQEIVENNSVPRVSQYRLATHLSAALLLYLGMLSTAIGIQRDAKFLKNPALVSEMALSSVKKFRGLVHTAGMLVFCTIVTGAFVAGLDAGLVYNEFPYMGEGLVPPAEEMWDDKYVRTGSDKIWRNMLENPVTAQFDHRATTTFGFILSLPFLVRRIPIASTRRLANLTAGAAVAQVTLGISTLLYLVPVPLAAMHQAGSVVLLTCIMALAGSIRRPSRMLKHLRR
ncbi:hypothetical protein IAU60_005758 [Kwoniella sp. DSM 27419]